MSSQEDKLREGVNANFLEEAVASIFSQESFAAYISG